MPNKIKYLSCAAAVYITFPFYSQLNLGKLKDKASKITSGSNNNAASTNTKVDAPSGEKIYNPAKDPFKGSGSIITTIAGSGTGSEFGFKDGKAKDALFDHPEGLTCDENGNVYVADKLTNRIRKISPEGEVTTFAGSGDDSNKNGVGTEASFNQPFYIWYDSKNFYVIEDRNTIRKINKEGKVSTIFKGQQYGGYTDGEIGDANFDKPIAVVTNSKGDILICDANNNCIRKISGGVVSTLAGNKNAKLTYETQVKDGPGEKASFWNLKSMCIDTDDNLYVIDAARRIRKISPDGSVNTLPFEELIKNTQSTYEIDDGSSHGVRDVGVFNKVGILSNGNFLISTDGGEIHEVSKDVKDIKFVFTGRHCNTFSDNQYRELHDAQDGEDCKGCKGSFIAKPFTVSKEGKIYFTDRDNHCVREIKLKK